MNNYYITVAITFFFFFLLSFNDIKQTKNTESNPPYKLTQERGRLLLLKQNGWGELSANLAAACAAELLFLLTHLNLQETK